ncbi:MAG: penicillin-binding transpeptidase domain-containing protein, partial [Planctomycetota bacterium]|nr:penicillin-binding transpeptidase domain-containing protein [Planctomycetota bacterium]
FKPFIWSVATELELCKHEQVFDKHGGRWYTPFGRYLEDVVKRDEQTWLEVLINSSNIGMAQAGLRMPPRQMRDAVTRFGFGSRTGLGLPGESVGLVTDLKNWSDYTRTSVPMGYEVAVTPVQMVRAFSAFARSGEMAGSLPPVRLTALPVDDPAPDMVYRVLPPWVAELARSTMRGVAKNLDTLMKQRGQMDFEPQYDLFGKSGTAKIARPDGRGYFEQYCSSFIAGAPVDNPRLVVLVVIDDPGPERVRNRAHYGSAVAGPVVRRIVERTLPYLGIAPPPQPATSVAAADAIAAD